MSAHPDITPYRHVRQGSARYPCYIGEGLLGEVGPIVSSLLPRARQFVVSSEVGRTLFEEQIRPCLGGAVPWIVLPDGEPHKTLGTAELVLGRLLELGAKRDAVLIVVGGGVTGDTAGFVASILLRGVALVHVPTTLLAQVDSSIGGKVAVNHASGKNLIGSFYPPAAVIADTSTVSTLPPYEFLSGLFEALKAGVIGDVELFELMETSRQAVLERDPAMIVEIVRRSVDLKAAIVEDDETEQDRRRLLNYGHTIGHAIEAGIGYEGLTHGEAVAWGMMAANAIAARRGTLSGDVRWRIDRAIRALEPRAVPQLDRALALRAVSHDKKFVEGRQVMVFPTGIGTCEIVSDVRDEEIQFGLDSVLV